MTSLQNAATAPVSRPDDPGPMLARSDARLVLGHLVVAFAALLLGGVCGLLQAWVRSGRLTLPANIGYYQLLTAHGVLMALVFTTFFIMGWLLSGMAHTLGGSLRPRVSRMAWAGYILMVAGTATTATPILLNDASVLYTFYAPMQAAPAYYIGLALVVVGSWLSSWAMFGQYVWWRRMQRSIVTVDAPVPPSPLFAYMSVVVLIIWQIATLGVAAEVLLQLIPWSLGWTDSINVLLSRSLFWFFGHPLVYFWLMPSYIAWYVVLPKIIGGKIFSDSLARLAFLMLMLFSIPVGFHHQFNEPGITEQWKFLHSVLTMFVMVPSLMTAFALFATLELAGRSRGGRGWLGWIRKLPWGDARFLALFMAMVLFIFGGAGGGILASNQLNGLFHNTIFITGHFHLTVASAVALSFFGIAYWLVPHVSGRAMGPRANRVALVQVGLWSVGMVIMSGAQHLVGLQGDPRRTAYVDRSADVTSGAIGNWLPYETAAAIGGSLLFVGVLLVVGLVVWLAWLAPRNPSPFPLGEVADDAVPTPALLERWRVWIAISVVLIIIAYAIPLSEQIGHAPPGSPPVHIS